MRKLTPEEGYFQFPGESINSLGDGRSECGVGCLRPLAACADRDVQIRQASPVADLTDSSTLSTPGVAKPTQRERRRRRRPSIRDRGCIEIPFLSGIRPDNQPTLS